jgi:hypothetical protein
VLISLASHKSGQTQSVESFGLNQRPAHLGRDGTAALA